MSDQGQIYFGDWKAGGRKAMLADFGIAEAVVADAEILHASYDYENYSGYALVLFRKDGKLYEVNGSHCSCYGLEGQWSPEETTPAALEMRKFYDIPADRVGVVRRVLAMEAA